MKTLTRFALLALLAGVCVSSALAGALITYEYDKYGNCTAISTGTKDGPVLEKTTYTYDDYRRPTSMTEAAQSSASSRTWTWVYDRYFGTQGYDASAHTSKQWRLQYEPAFDAAGHRNVTARWFDHNDRIVDEYTGLIDTPGAGLSAGEDLEVHHLGYDENGQKNDYIDPRGRETTYAYDLRNRLWKTTEPLNRTTETLYDVAGNKTDVTFPDTRSQHWRNYDAFGQAWTFLDERNNQTDLTYEWGPMKKLHTVTTYRDKDGGGTEPQLTRFEPDGLGRPVWTFFPDSSTELTTYSLGQVNAFKTRKEQTKRITYDTRGREVLNTFDRDEAPGISRSWDDANRADTLCNKYSTIKYEYDDAGLVKTEINTIAGSFGAAKTAYERYPNGNVSRIVYPEGSSIRRDYNSRGQLSATGSSDSSNNWRVQYATYKYLADGKLDYQDYGNGVHTAFGYDERGFLKQETVTRAGLTYADRTYTRDNRDRIISFRKGTSSANPMENGHGDRFRYDEEGQLVEAWYNATDPANSGAGNNRYDGFTYDALGNRKGADPAHPLNFIASRGWMAFTRDDNGLNQYGSWGSSPVQHDDDVGGTWGSPGHANGVLMFDGNVTAGYNALNQPMYINTASAGWVSFGYDPLGRCVKRWAGLDAAETANPATYFYYDGWNLIQEGPSASTISQLYMLGNRVDEIVADYAVANGQWMYHSSDGRGHAMLLTAANGSLAEQYEYDAFGQPYFFSSTAQPLNSSAFGNRFLFTGREYLSDLKLYDYRNRLFQPELGRFMQPDPKQFEAGDYNLYRYCHNDPVNKTDPFGLQVYDRDFQMVDGSQIPGKFGNTESAVTAGVSPVSDGHGTFSLVVTKFNIVVTAKQVATTTNGHQRSTEAIKASKEHENRHVERMRSIDRANQNKVLKTGLSLSAANHTKLAEADKVAGNAEKALQQDQRDCKKPTLSWKPIVLKERDQ